MRYVGKTSRMPAKRLQAHMQRARGVEVYHLQRWLRSLSAPPIIEVLEWCLPMHWEARERYWIALARDYGCDLVNTTEGGDARPDNFGRKATPEHCAKISKAQKGRKKSKEEIENNRWTEDRREVMRLALSGDKNPMFGHTGVQNSFYGKHHAPETRARFGAASGRTRLGKKRGPYRKTLQ